MLKEIAILSAKCIYAHFDCQIYLWYICIVVDHRVGLFPFSVSVMLQTLRKFSICATQDIILKSYAKTDSNSFKTGNTPQKLFSAEQYSAHHLQICTCISGYDLL